MILTFVFYYRLTLAFCSHNSYVHQSDFMIIYCMQEMIICKVKRTGVTPAGRAGMSSVVSDSTDNATELTSVADPFLHQVGSNVDHSRQESADSGLGGICIYIYIALCFLFFLLNQHY